jgi:hypothetical protein
MNPSFVFWILKPIFNKRCADMIPMGKYVKEVNCFSICIDGPDGSPLLLVDSLAPPVFVGRKWTGTQYLDAHTINIEDVLPSQIRIRHYYGPHTIKYDGLYDYILNGATGSEKFKADFSRLIHGTHKFIFNRKSLVTKSRIELLRFLIDRHISVEDKDKTVHVLMVMQELYSVYCHCHPQFEQQKERLRLLLDSFVESGELRSLDSSLCYKITPKAMTTLSNCEIEERRHAENATRQKQLNWLTGALVFVGFLQAFLIWASLNH